MPRDTNTLGHPTTSSAAPPPTPGPPTGSTSQNASPDATPSGATAADAGTDQRATFLDLSLTQLAGGALAASSAAALGARIGVGGTLLGAALGSLVSAIAGAAYTHSLRRTRDFVLRRGRPDDADGSPAAGEPATDPDELSPTSAGPGERESARYRRFDLGRLEMRRVALGAGALFALVIALLTGIELATGHSLDGKQGTTVGQVTKVASKARATTSVPGDRDLKPAGGSSSDAPGSSSSSDGSATQSPSGSDTTTEVPPTGPTATDPTTDPTTPQTPSPTTTEPPAGDSPTQPVDPPAVAPTGAEAPETPAATDPPAVLPGTGTPAAGSATA